MGRPFKKTVLCLLRTENFEIGKKNYRNLLVNHSLPQRPSNVHVINTGIDVAKATVASVRDAFQECGIAGAYS